MVKRVLGAPASGARTIPVSSKYESSVALTNIDIETGPALLNVLGWAMSVMSRTTMLSLPRSVTKARHRFDGGGQGLAVGLALGEMAADGEGVFPAVGVEPPHADAISAVTASARIQLARFMSCSGNGPGGN